MRLSTRATPEFRRYPWGSWLKDFELGRCAVTWFLVGLSVAGLGNGSPEDPHPTRSRVFKGSAEVQRSTDKDLGFWFTD